MCRMFRQIIVLCLLLSAVLMSSAQDNIHVHIRSYSNSWSFPLSIDEVGYFNFNADQSRLQAHVKGGGVVPFISSEVDTITFQYALTELTGNHYKVFQMYITTDEGERVSSKDEYVGCYVSINGGGSFPHYSGKGKIRGRGNSTWLWYDKKPYRIKLDESSPLLGMGSNRDWVLLANYRDVTDLMNTFVFEAGHRLGMPYTNHTRYTEVFLNGEYIGLYQLTEQVEQGEYRVNVDDERGILLALDLDDGPGLSPDATDNFYSEVFRLPVCIKHPDEDKLTLQLKDSIKQEFAKLETAINNKSFSQSNRLMDRRIFVRYLILQELVGNVELNAPRSVYIHKDVDGKWMMGPLWDFDAGYDFDWSTMKTGHDYYHSYKELILGSDPYRHRGAYDANLSSFFTNLFGSHGFVTLFKEEWNAMKGELVAHSWAEMELYLDELNHGTIMREFMRWPLQGKQHARDVSAMHEWLLKRVDYLDGVINAYPMPK